MAKKKTQKNNEEDVKKLKAELAKARKEIQILSMQLADANRTNAKLSKAFDWLESHYNGFCVEKSFVQRIDPAESIAEAREFLDAMLSQEGCCGGRIMPWGDEHTLRVQTFWEDEKPPSLWSYLEFDNMILPSGIRHVFVMPGQYKAVGIIPSRVGV